MIGLASGSTDRPFREREIDALSRFAQLASIALDNARLVDDAQRGALYDQTTGLPNRELLTDRIAHSLARAASGRSRVDRRHPPRPRPVQGHQRERRPHRRRPVARVGRAAPRGPPAAGRHGGPVRRRRVRGPARPGRRRGRGRPHRRADRAELRAPFALGDREWFISASIGIAVGDAGRATPDELLREAEIAMVRAKADPTHRHALFEPSMSAATLERIDLENDLRRGARARRAAPATTSRSSTSRPTGSSGSRRWCAGSTRCAASSRRSRSSRWPRRPGSSCRSAAGCSRRACRQAVAWRDARPTAPPLFMSVNLSARQFAQPDLVDEVQRILAETGLDADDARARDHRERPDGPDRGGDPDAPTACATRRPAGARRLRDRLLVACRTSSTCRSTRSRSTGRSSRDSTAQADRVDRRGGHRARPRPRDRRGRRGHRDRDAARAGSASSAATSARATCSRGRCPDPRRRGCCKARRTRRVKPGVAAGPTA